ncbi:ABC transporter [Cordyceps javanica]|uniref:ABC transporter n=1 Tax=Cordyceps javanica TaxID=43265 RepID=A0A545UKM4_9HYPO|nr:ABC transporter [Cordyceps javanica]
MYSNDGVLPDAHWLNVLIMLYQRGLPQMVMAVISVIVLGFQLLRQPRRMPGNVLKQKPKSSILVESIGLILNVLTLSLFIAAVGMFGLILAAEGLPLMIIAREYSVGRPIIRAAASLCCSVGFVVLAPHEWIAQADDFLEHASEPTYEETCSWIDYCLTYSWARGLVRGANGIITIDQLDQLPSAYSPELLRRKFSDVRKTQPTTTCALLSLLRTQLLLCTTLGVFLATAQLISPMGLHRLLEYMQHPDEAVFQPWLWVAIICGGRIVQTALQQAYSSYSRKLVAQVSAMLTAEVYQSALASRELHGDFLSADNIQSKEEPQSTASGILENLISSDIQNITQLHDVLICVTAIPAAAAAVVGLYQLVGWPCLVGIILALSGSPFESWVMEYVGNHEEQLKTAQDLRISLASEYLRSIKIIKYFGWEESAAKNIARARATEQKHVTAIDIFSTALSLIADFFPILSLVTIFGLHVSVRKMPLTASTAYMTIQLLEIVKDCLVFLALVSVDFSKAMVSLRRLDKFFKSLTPLDTYPNRPAEIQNATFQRAAGAAFYLRDINIKFIQGGLNVVTGDSGSGKSSLLLALLGETVKKSGSVTRQQDTAYAPQTVWLQAGTIQDNILFHNTYNETRYRNVVDACRLDVDFAEMQHGDQTVIGDGGFAFSVATCFFHTGAGIYTNYWMSRWVEHSGDSGSSTSYFLMRYIGLSYLTEAIDGVRMMAFSKGISVAANKLHMDMINALMAAPLSWFSEQAISTVLNSLSGDMSTLDQSIYHSIVPVISDIIKCMLMMGAVASKLPIFILPALALLVLGCLIARMHEGVSHLLTELVSSSRSPVLSAFSEGLTGSMVIRATSSTSAIFHAKMNRLLCASSRAQHAQSNASQWLKFRMSILATVINVLAASLVLSQSGKMSAGFAGFCLSQATQLSDKVLALIFSFNNLSVVMQTFQRVQEYAQLAPEKDCVTKSIRYNPNGQDILKNISLRIEPGSRVAIVGRTGSGKSTLISSLLGFTKVVSGQILYDGVDLQAIPYKRLRHCISTIPQEAQLFQGTLASNLDPSETVPESELQDALDVCQRILRSADEAGATATGLADSTTNSAFTERLTLSTMVKTKGENFSHGQRQVLSLCRVLIRRSKLVLLDEATSSMDARTDAGVQEALRTELSRAGSENRVLVTVAHRLQTIMDYDMVVVMGLGRILEVGSPNDLMAKKSTFYDMVMHVGEK